MKSRFFFCVVALVTTNLSAALLAAIYASGIWAIIALLCYVSFCFILYRSRPASFLLLSPLLFLRFTEMLSGIPIEFGAYIDELAMHGSATGGFNRLSAVLIVFFSFCSFLIEPSWARVQVKFQSLPTRVGQVGGARYVLSALIIALGYLLMTGFRSGFSLLDEIDRFRYRLEVQDSLFVSILNNLPIFAALLGLLALDRQMRRTCIFAFICMFIVAILFSEKFTSLSLMTILALIPAGLCYASRNKYLPLGYIFFIPIGIAALTMPLVLLVYGYTENPELALQKLSSRMTSQGELWWVADRDHLEMFRFNAETVIADVKTWLVPSAQSAKEVGTSFGLYMVMQQYAPSEISYAAALQGIGYVFSLFAYLLMTFGVCGLLLVGLAVHAAYSLTAIFLLKSFADGDWIRTVLAMKLFVFNVSGGFIVGYLWFFFGIKSLVIIAAILFLQRVNIRVSFQGGLREKTRS